MAIEADVAEHYTHGGKLAVILAGLQAMGRDPERPDMDDLSLVDELHMGGREATKAVAEKLELRPGVRVLDVGSGLGGPARLLANSTGASVEGVDLTLEHVEVANELTRRTGLAGLVTFHVGSALDLPFPPASFDRAMMIHVAMNIMDKRRLFADVHRVLRPGALFVVYDPMRVGEGDIDFPVPWAKRADMSLLESPGFYRNALIAAGFRIEAETDRTAMALAFMERGRARIAKTGPLPLGPHISMGADAPKMRANLTAALERGIVSPIEMVARRAN